jgi:hypothetical protein
MTKARHNRISAKQMATGMTPWSFDACASFGSNPSSSVITMLRQGGKETEMLFGYERLSRHD